MSLTLALGLIPTGAPHLSSGARPILTADTSADASERSFVAPGCTANPTFADGKVPRQVRHVAVTGNDALGDGSNNRPFRTLARAAERVDAGTAIYLHAGTHAGGTFLSDLRGSHADPIWIMGAPNEDRPVIRGGSEGLHLVRPRYVVLQNIEIRESADNGINVDDGGEYANAEAARFVVFRDLDIHDTGLRPSGAPSCLKLAGLNDFVVTGSRVARCGAPQTMSAVGVNGVGVHRGSLRLNHFTQNGYGGVQFKGGSADIEISASLFEDTGPRAVNMGGNTGGPLFRPPLSTSSPNYEAARIRVSASVFTGSETAAAFVGCIDCEFRHNTVVNPSKWLLRILQETTEIDGHRFAAATRGLIANNIFYFRRSAMSAGEDINVGRGTDSRSFSLSRNLWYTHDNPAESRPRLPTFSGAHFGSLVGADPRFANPGAGDFRLLATSPARAVGNPSFTVSADRTDRCYGSPPSLGAFEYAD